MQKQKIRSKLQGKTAGNVESVTERSLNYKTMNDTPKTVGDLHAIVAQRRRDRFKDSPQFTLGNLIDKLEAFLPNQDFVKNKYGDEASVRFDFEYAIPTGLGSWRGSYSELAINFNFLGYEYFGATKPEEISLSDFIGLLKSAIGKEYTGWKGGEYIMSRETPLWVANDGNSGDTGVVGVEDNEYEIILITQRCEY